jgi:hypothetical protein
MSDSITHKLLEIHFLNVNPPALGKLINLLSNFKTFCAVFTPI